MNVCFECDIALLYFLLYFIIPYCSLSVPWCVVRKETNEMKAETAFRPWMDRPLAEFWKHKLESCSEAPPSLRAGEDATLQFLKEVRILKP